MDSVFFSGNIITMDERCPRASAVCVRDGRVLALGGDEDMLALAGRGARKISLDGATVLPGLCDTHLHLLGTGSLMERADVSGARSAEAVLDALRAYIAKNPPPPGMPVEGRGFNQDLYPDGRMITRADLDAVSPDIPIMLTRVCGHVVVANSALMRLRGIDDNTRVPDGGTMNIANGQFAENAIGLLREGEGLPTLADVKRRLKLAMRAAQRSGLVCAYSDDFGSDPQLVMRAYRELADAGEMRIRVRQQCALPDFDAMDAFFAGARDPGNDMYRLSAVKLYADGSLGARTAWLREPYADAPGTCGVPVYGAGELCALVARAQEHDMPAVIHAIGSAAIDCALDAIAHARAHKKTRLPHGVVHCQITDTAILDRFKALDVVAYIQPIFLNYDLHICQRRVGERLASTSYAWRSLLARGVCACGGSDSPVENLAPLPNIYSAVTRTDLQGFPEGGWQANEKLSVAEAISLFTTQAARAVREETSRGRLCPGLLADMTVLEEDPFSVAPERIKDIRPRATVLSGEWQEIT